MKRLPRTLAVSALAMAALAGVSWAALESLDRAFPPPLPDAASVSAEVTDRDGQLLRAFATPDGRWRLATTLDQVDRQFVDMLVAYEDKRFWDHPGIDAFALARAAGQFAAQRRIVSGGSTLSMQLARLIEPRESRSLASKLRQMVRAIQIERRLSKRDILETYLTLAPYGGNLEGVRAASLAWFGKEPKRLTVAQAALLVALPQLPEARRPDRHPRYRARRPRPRARPHGDGRPARRAGSRPRRARPAVLDAPRPAGACRARRRHRSAQPARAGRPSADAGEKRAGRARGRGARGIAETRAPRLGRHGHGRRHCQARFSAKSARPASSRAAAPAGST